MEHLTHKSMFLSKLKPYLDKAFGKSLQVAFLQPLQAKIRYSSGVKEALVSLKVHRSSIWKRFNLKTARSVSFSQIQQLSLVIVRGKSMLGV